MRAIKGIFRSRKARKRRVDLTDTASLSAFAQLSGAEQSMLAQSLVAARDIGARYPKAS